MLRGYDYRGGLASLREQLARQPDLYGSVRIGGPISGMEKRRFLLDAEGFVLPSRWESHSVALLEVLSLGIPSIVSSVLHVAPVLQRYDAAVLATPDATSLAAALLQFDEAKGRRSARSVDGGDRVHLETGRRTAHGPARNAWADVTGDDVTGTTLIVCSRDRPEFLSRVRRVRPRGRGGPGRAPHRRSERRATPRPRPAISTPRCAFRYLHSATVGLSRSRNVAIRAASHPTIVFTDDDVLVPPDWFGTIVRSLRAAAPRAVVTGRVLATDAEIDGAFAPSLHPGTDAWSTRAASTRIRWQRSTWPFERSAHAEIGGFDVRLGPGTPFPAAEDNDFGFRLLEAGYRIVFDPGAVVYHRAWRDDRSYVALSHGYGRGQGAFYAKHLSFEDRYMLRRMIGTLVNHVRRLPRAAWIDAHASLAVRSPSTGGAPRRSSRSPNLARAEIGWIGGFLAGMLEWLITYRRFR